MKERKTQNSNSTTRTVDREYYAHPETNRNKWFSYTDPYYTGDNSQLQEYQENLQHQQNSEQSSSQENYSTGNSQSTQNCNGCKNEFNNHQQSGSTTNYAQYAKQNQYSSETQDTNLNAWENTSTPEPFVDTENHTNFNTSPKFAGDNNYDSFTRTEQNANTCKCDETYSNDYNNDNEGNFNHTHQYDCTKSCSNSTSQSSNDKSSSKSSSTSKSSQKNNKGGNS